MDLLRAVDSMSKPEPRRVGRVLVGALCVALVATACGNSGNTLADGSSSQTAKDAAVATLSSRAIADLVSGELTKQTGLEWKSHIKDDSEVTSANQGSLSDAIYGSAACAKDAAKANPLKLGGTYHFVAVDHEQSGIDVKTLPVTDSQGLRNWMTSEAPTCYGVPAPEELTVAGKPALMFTVPAATDGLSSYQLLVFTDPVLLLSASVGPDSKVSPSTLEDLSALLTNGG